MPLSTYRLFITWFVTANKSLFASFYVYTFGSMQQGDVSSAEKYAEIARDSDPYNAAAFVCLGNCSLRRADYKKARDFFLCALENDAACVEALYNLGINHASSF